MRASNSLEPGSPDHGVAGHACLAAASGHLAHDLSLEALAVEAPLTRHHEGGGAHQLVEAQGVEHERRAGHQ